MNRTRVETVSDFVHVTMLNVVRPIFRLRQLIFEVL